MARFNQGRKTQFRKLKTFHGFVFTYKQKMKIRNCCVIEGKTCYHLYYQLLLKLTTQEIIKKNKLQRTRSSPSAYQWFWNRITASFIVIHEGIEARCNMWNFSVLMCVEQFLIFRIVWKSNFQNFCLIYAFGCACVRYSFSTCLFSIFQKVAITSLSTSVRKFEQTDK